MVIVFCFLVIIAAIGHTLALPPATNAQNLAFLRNAQGIIHNITCLVYFFVKQHEPAKGNLDFLKIYIFLGFFYWDVVRLKLNYDAGSLVVSSRPTISGLY